MFRFYRRSIWRAVHARETIWIPSMNQPTDLPFVFGGLERDRSAFETARVLIWPVPYEKTVSYGLGTREGPEAIIDASRYMELYDEELGGETADIGIHTLEPIETERAPEE